ncbi:MAG TPA: FtsQ-type POTRA domain-containing protein [Thermoanaerobacterales bacterium]|nr:FtsQ-type POTRA domain-containing protein [Thermoanaerobacterales bacterium]
MLMKEQAPFEIYRNQEIKRKINFKRLLLIIFFLCIITVIPIIKGPFFNIENIEIAGNESISKKEILRCVSQYYGKNLLVVKQDVVKNAIMQKFPIKEVQVKHKLPNTLSINIKEREIVAALNYLNGFVLIDCQGVIVKKVSRLESYSIPIITGLTISDAKVAKQPSIDKNSSEHYKKVLTCIKHLTQIMPELSEIHLDFVSQQQPEISLYTLDGYEILLGNADEKKMDYIKDLLEDIRTNDRGKGVLDMSCDIPVFKPFE